MTVAAMTVAMSMIVVMAMSIAAARPAVATTTVATVIAAIVPAAIAIVPAGTATTGAATRIGAAAGAATVMLARGAAVGNLRRRSGGWQDVERANTLIDGEQELVRRQLLTGFIGHRGCPRAGRLQRKDCASRSERHPRDRPGPRLHLLSRFHGAHRRRRRRFVLVAHDFLALGAPLPLTAVAAC